MAERMTSRSCEHLRRALVSGTTAKQLPGRIRASHDLRASPAALSPRDLPLTPVPELQQIRPLDTRRGATRKALLPGGWLEYRSKDKGTPFLGEMEIQASTSYSQDLPNRNGVLETVPQQNPIEM